MWKFIKSEWKFWASAPMTWIFLLINALLIFGAVSSDNISIGGGVGSVHKNAPYVIENYYGVMSLICLLMTTAFMNSTANRDFQHGMYQFIFTSPIKKSDYFFGKFFGAATIAVIPLLGVSIGALLAPLMPWTQPERYSEVIWSGHLMGLIAFAIPNVIITGVMLYTLAMIFRSNIVSFIGAVGIIILYSIASGFTADIEKEWLANLLDPFGFRAAEIMSKYMTIDEKNLTPIPFSGPLLINRLVWLAISTVLLLFTYKRFSFTFKKTSAKKIKEKVAEAIPLATNRTFEPKNAGAANLKTLAYLIRTETKSIIRNPTFIIITIIGLLNLIASMTSFTGRYGSDQYPVTYDVIDSIRGSFYLFLIGFITFYSGVIVWKERDNRLNEILDATPVRTGYLFISKFIAMMLTLELILASAVAVGMIGQLLYGYTRFQFSVYATSVLFLDMLNFSYLIIIALLFHYLINNRYIAYFAFIAFIIANQFIWRIADVETKMVMFGDTPSITYSDMNGYGVFLKGALWFHLYWILIGILVLCIAFAFFVRGKELEMRSRLKTAAARLKSGRTMTITLVLLALLCGSFVYYNTKVLNTYVTDDEEEKIQIDYEKKYKKYEGLDQPRIIAVDYRINLDPANSNLISEATMWLRNTHNHPISELHFSMPGEIDSVTLTIPNSLIKLRDDRTRYRIVTLTKPLQPNDSISIEVKAVKIRKGFENEVTFKMVNPNGTFFNNTDICPILGYSEDAELSDKNKRKEKGLPPRKRIPTLNENDYKSRSNNYVIQDADWVRVHTIIRTAKDQTAIAPGSLIRKWQEGDQAVFEYALDKNSLNFYSLLSARYAIEKKLWKGISLEVYYIPEHRYNVENMMRSMEKSLDYYTANFGPYFHKQCRIIEFPRYASFAQAFPGTMPYSESIGFIEDLRDVKEEDIDMVYYVVAHEMGHQYWAHQVCGAKMQGSEMMSEGFAQYSALMVMEKEYGKDKMKKFLKYEMDGYLRGRSSEFEAERPLMNTEHQGYIHYQKASVILYYLKEMIGENKVNEAMRSLIDSFAYRQPPYPTSLSAIRAFQKVTPDSLQYLMHDLFESITIFSNRVTEASYKKTGSTYEVKIQTHSEKFSADSLGRTTLLPLHDYIDVAVFAGSDNKLLPGKVLKSERVKVSKQDNTFTFTVNEKPSKAGIDPYNYLIDRMPDDNLKTVSEE